MKILIHSGFDWDPFSGIGRIIVSSGEALRRLGAEVDILSGRGEGEGDNHYTYLDNYPGSQFSLQESWDPLGSAYLFHQFTRGKRYDLVHSHAQWAYHPALARKLFGGDYRLITFAHGISSALYREWRKEAAAGRVTFPLRARLKSWSLIAKSKFSQKQADAIVVPSRGVADDIRRYLNLSSHIIPYGVDSNLFRPDPQKREVFRSRYKLDDSRIVCLFVGTPAWRKGLYYLRDAFRNLPDNYLLCLVGLLPRESKVIARDLGRRRIIDRGQVRDLKALAEIYSGCDIFAFPSLYEGLPMVLMEAMSSGLACLVADCNGAGDLIRNGVNGIVVPRRDAAALTVQLRSLGDGKLRRRLARAGRGSIEKLSWERMARRCLNLYQEVLSR